MIWNVRWRAGHLIVHNSKKQERRVWPSGLLHNTVVLIPAA